MNPYLTFFHNTHLNWQETPALFNPLLRKENKKELLRPTFYWFNDFYHHHLPMTEPYFYLFVKNPKRSNIALKSRHESGDFHSLCVHQYEDYYLNRKNKKLNLYYDNANSKEYCEPSIIMSFSKIEPDVVIRLNKKAEYKYDGYGTILYPLTHKGKEVYLFDQIKYPIKFTNIPEIVNIVPQINYSYPFLTPNKVDGIYIYDDWLPMISDKINN